MRRYWLGLLGSLGLAACGGLEPSNTDLGVHVAAEVWPVRLSLRDSAAVLRIRVVVTNPADTAIEIVTGGPPYTFTGDPADSHGLSESIRLASATEPLNAGPGLDYWGEPVIRIAPRRGYYVEHVVTLREWRAGGWPLEPGVYRARSWLTGREGESAAFRLVP